MTVDMLRAAVLAHEDYVKAETQADTLCWGKRSENAIRVEIEGVGLWISIERCGGEWATTPTT